MNRVIPEDEHPGAWDAGCGDYLFRQLNGQLAHLHATYRAGLDGLDAEARAEFAQGFADLATDQQDGVLGRVETGSVSAAWTTPPQGFFTTLVNHTAEGYYADPGQGGNRDRVSWQMVGFNGR